MSTLPKQQSNKRWWGVFTLLLFLPFLMAAGVTPGVLVNGVFYSDIGALLSGASIIDDTKGNGDTGYVWSADKVFDQLALKQAVHAMLTGISTLSDPGADSIPFYDNGTPDAWAWKTIGTAAGTIAAGDHAHSGVYEPVDATIVRQADVDDTPVDGVATAPVSSNWAYDHVAAADPHPGYLTESAIGAAYDTSAELAALFGGKSDTTHNHEITGLTSWPAGLDVTELGYVNGVTSAIQTQLNAKQASDSALTTLASKVFAASGTIGGTAGMLDAIPVASIADGDIAVVSTTGGKVQIYSYASSSATAEADNSVIQPDDNAGNGRWLIQSWIQSGVQQFSTINLPSSNADPGTTAGQIRHDSTVTGLLTGALAWYDGDKIRYIVDLDVLPSDDGYVVAYNAGDDKFYMKADAAGGGSGSVTTLKEATSQVGGADIVTIDFGAGFDLTEDPDTEINIAFDPTEITVWDLGSATSFELPNSDDPDIDAAGEISWDTDGWIRAYDGTNQVAVGRKLEAISVTIVKPNDMADAVRDAFPIWENTSGMSFVVTGWSAKSAADNTTLNLEETDTDGANNVTVDAVEIATKGTGLYYATDTTITAATIETGHILWIDFDDTDDPAWVKVTVYGYYNADVN